MGCAWRQTGFWHDSETLWTHALTCTASNCTAHNNLGNALLHSGRLPEAIAHYQEVLKVNEDYSEAHNNLANALASLGHLDEAAVHYRWSLKVQPNYAEAYYNLGNLLANRGQLDEAIVQYQRALAITDYAEAHNNLGNVLSRCGRFDEGWPSIKGPWKSIPASRTPIATWATPCCAVVKRRSAFCIIGGPWSSKPDFALAYCELGSAPMRAEGPKQRCRTFRRPWNSSPTWSMLTSSWVWPSPVWAAMTRRSPSIGRPCKRSRRTPRLTAAWRGCWRPARRHRSATGRRPSNMPSGRTSFVAARGPTCSTR